jgi:hypothetical protein
MTLVLAKNSTWNLNKSKLVVFGGKVSFLFFVLAKKSSIKKVSKQIPATSLENHEPSQL